MVLKSVGVTKRPCRSTTHISPSQHIMIPSQHVWGIYITSVVNTYSAILTLAHIQCWLGGVARVPHRISVPLLGIGPVHRHVSASLRRSLHHYSSQWRDGELNCLGLRFQSGSGFQRSGSLASNCHGCPNINLSVP